MDTNLDKNEISNKIKEYARSIGFDAVGISKLETIDNVYRESYLDWIQNKFQSGMEYMSNNINKRVDPSLLLPEAKSIISLALNYYPQEKQSYENPQFAYYAYGRDYHLVVKEKLQRILHYIQEINHLIEGRVFCDTAPILERYWAYKSGIGFIGNNSMLIIPGKGSFFFLGEIFLNIELVYDKPIKNRCGNCTKCISSCPTKAIGNKGCINSNLCLSYQTIENKGEIDEKIIPYLNNYIYGCDICQKVCPWNRFSKSNSSEEFKPTKEFFNLTYSVMNDLSIEDYQRIFRKSAVKRAKYSGLKRNLAALKKLNKKSDF